MTRCYHYGQVFRASLPFPIICVRNPWVQCGPQMWVSIQVNRMPRIKSHAIGLPLRVRVHVCMPVVMRAHVRVCLHVCNICFVCVTGCVLFCVCKCACECTFADPEFRRGGSVGCDLHCPIDHRNTIGVIGIGCNLLQ